MKRKGHDINGLDACELICLIRWPKGSVGWFEEMDLMVELNALCKRFGYGRIPQLTAQIEDIWRQPERVKHYKKEQEEFGKMMKSCEESLKKEKQDEDDHREV